MGVDTGTYRQRIGLFNSQAGSCSLNATALLFKLSTRGLLLWLLLYLLLCGDVETNPGPIPHINGFLLNTKSVKSVSNRHNKLVELRSLVAFYQAKIICLTETWLTPDISDTELFPDDDFIIYRHDRSDGYGGVLIAVHSSIKSTSRSDLIDSPDDNFQLLVVEIDFPKMPKLALINFYNPNSLHVRFQKFHETLRRVKAASFQDIHVMGDFNLPDLDITTGIPTGNHNNATDFYNTFQEFDLEHKVTCPTHILGNRLDLILSNSPEKISNVYTEEIFTSDHSVIHFS